MDTQEWEVRTSLVKRFTVKHRVYAASKARAVDLVIAGKGQRVHRDEKLVEKPNHTAKKVRKA